MAARQGGMLVQVRHERDRDTFSWVCSAQRQKTIPAGSNASEHAGHQTGRVLKSSQELLIENSPKRRPSGSNSRTWKLIVNV